MWLNRPVSTTGKEVCSGRFVIFHEELGAGSVGAVRVAFDRKTRRECAVKIVAKAALTPEQKAEVKQEISIHANLSHPNISRLLQSFQDETHVYIFMDLVTGGTLLDYLMNHTLEEAHLKLLFRGVCKGLKYLHDHRIAHRDLKLENLLINADATRVLISDFGLAGSFDDEPFIKFCGSPEYLPPEIILQRPYRGAKADIWSLGVCLYGMAFRAFPFQGDSEQLVFKSILSATLKVPACPALLRDLLHGMLTKDPIARLSLDQVSHHPFIHRRRQRLKLLKCFCL